MPRKDKDRPLSPEEKELWEGMAQDQDIVPIKKRERSTPAKPKQKIPPKQSAPLPVLPKTMRDLPELESGGYAGVDRNLKERFRKGELTIDGRLDLHGKTRETARRMVLEFVEKHIHAGSRCLLIITGKGVHHAEAREERGVLRDMLPLWLNEQGLRPYILAFDTASVQHGGRGAFYVLLRRIR